MRILALLFAALSLNCAAAPFVVHVGLERIVLDTPPGFSNTTELASPRLQELGEALTSASNRILVFALTDADTRRFTNGDQIDAKRYMLAAVPREAESGRINAAQFTALVAESLRELGKPPGTADFLKYLDGKPLGKANLLLELKREPEVVSVLVGTRLTAAVAGGFLRHDQPATYLFSTNTLMVIRGKPLQLSVYTGFESPADVDWLKTITQHWVDELLRLNR